MWKYYSQDALKQFFFYHYEYVSIQKTMHTHAHTTPALLELFDMILLLFFLLLSPEYPQKSSTPNLEYYLKYLWEKNISSIL